jgi:hypothetical protein
MNNSKYKFAFKDMEGEWNSILYELQQYININKRKPSRYNIEVTKIYNWLSNQTRNYKSKGMKDPIYQHKWYNFVTDPKYKQYFDQDIIKPDPIEIQNNNPLDELDIIKPEQIETKQDLKDALNNIPDITSILNKYEEDLKI